MDLTERLGIGGMTSTDRRLLGEKGIIRNCKRGNNILLHIGYKIQQSVYINHPSSI